MLKQRNDFTYALNIWFSFLFAALLEQWISTIYLYNIELNIHCFLLVQTCRFMTCWADQGIGFPIIPIHGQYSDKLCLFLWINNSKQLKTFQRLQYSPQMIIINLKKKFPTSMGEYSEKIKSPFIMTMNGLFCMCISFAQRFLPWQFLNFLPLPHGQGSLGRGRRSATYGV